MKTRPNTKLSFSSDSVRQETQLWFGALDSVLIQIQKFECMEYKNTIKYGFYFAGERRKSNLLDLTELYINSVVGGCGEILRK